MPLQPVFEESEIIDLNLNSEIRYLEFNNIWEFNYAYNIISQGTTQIIIPYGKHKFKKRAWIIVFYWPEDIQ